MPPLAVKLIQKCLQVNPHLRPSSQELLNDEWFVSLGIVKKKPQELRFKEADQEGYVSERGINERRDLGPRNVSQGRGVAEKINSTIDRSRDKRIGGYGTGVLSSTSMGKFQTDSYTSINKQSSNNLSSTMKDFLPSTPGQYPGSPIHEVKESPQQPLQLRSNSRGRPEDEKQKFLFTNVTPVPSYTQSVISASDLPKKQNDGFSSPTDTSTQKQHSYSQLGPYSNLPPKQLYPLLQNSQQTPVYEQPVITSSHQLIQPQPISQPLSLSSTLKSPIVPQHIPYPDIQKQELDTEQPTSPGPRSNPLQDQLTAMKARVSELETNNTSLENKNSVMAKDLKELKKINSQLKAAIESLQSKDSAFEKMKRDREKLEKEVEEKMLECNKIKEEYEGLKNEFIEIARFIRSNVKPNWVVMFLNLAKFSE